MKIKIFLITLFFILTSSNNSFSKPRCENFYDDVYNHGSYKDLQIDNNHNQKTIGIRLLKFWNENKEKVIGNKIYKSPGWDLSVNKDGYFIVGKITSSLLANISKDNESIKVGDVILSINGIDLREVYKDPKKKYLLQNDVSDLFEVGEAIVFKILRKNKVFEIGKYDQKSKPLITNKLRTFESPLIDFSTTSIDINEKSGFFLATIETSFYEEYDKRYEITSSVHTHLVDDKEFDKNRNLINYYWFQCSFSDQKWSELDTVDPAYGVKIFNVISEDKSLKTSSYNIKPKHNLSYDKINESYYFKQDKAEITYSSKGVYKIKSKFNLKTFPFDKQKIEIFLYNHKFDVEDFRALVTSYTMEKALAFKKENQIQGWNIDNVDLVYKFFRNSLEKTKVHDGIALQLEVSRKYWYYIFKIILPIILILTICWSSVWINPIEIESRLTITIVCLLSLIAYNFVIDNDIPKLEYLTIMDYVILISYIYAAIPNFLSIVSYNLVKKNKKKQALKYENLEKKFGLPSYLLLIILIILSSVASNYEYTGSVLSWAGSK